MENSGGKDLSLAEIESVVKAISINNPGLSKQVSIETASNSVSDIRPDATEHEIAGRSLELKRKWEAIKKEQNKRVVEIRPSGKVILEQLKPELFTLTRLLISREYRRRTSNIKAAGLVVQRWAREIFSDDQDLPNLTFTDSTGNALPTELIMNIHKDPDLDTLAKKREKLCNSFLNNPEFSDIKREILDVEIKKLTQTEYETLIPEAILKEIRRLRRKDKLAQPRDTLTTGLEIEIEAPQDPRVTKIKNLNRRIALTDKFGGVPVTYDGVAEMPLPYSFNIRDQLRVLYELYKLGLIPPDYNVGIHFNSGGNVDWGRGVSDALELMQICYSADILGSSRYYIEDEFLNNENRRVVNNGWGRKPLFEFNQDGPAGFPIVIRDNGNLELRFNSHTADFYKESKDLVTTETMLEIAAASLRLNQNVSTNVSKDKAMADVWTYIKTENRKLLSEQRNGELAERVYSFTDYGGNAERDYGTLLWKTLRFSALELRIKEQSRGSLEKDTYLYRYQELCREARRRVRLIQEDK
jgi:hypothetical protein